MGVQLISLTLRSRLTGLGTCSALGVFVSVFLSLVGQSKNINYVVARSFHGLVAPLAGWRFTVEGEENLTKREGPAVVIGNHQTMIDILCTFSRYLCGRRRRSTLGLWGRLARVGLAALFAC